MIDPSFPNGPVAAAKRDLFLASLLFLFMELAFIRWFPAQVLFLTFFTNTVLLASFLGLSLGCLAARGARDYLVSTPVLLAVSMIAAAAMETVRLALQDILDVGKNAFSPQVVFFGTEVKLHDVASFIVPMELVAGVFFVLIAAVMIGPGQVIGRRFAAIPNAVQAYMVNIAGSLAGILIFNAFSWWLSPVWWFAFIAAGLAYLLLGQSPRRWWAVGLALAAPVLLELPQYYSLGVIRSNYAEEFWSPYYRINYSPLSRTIVVNLLGHQNMISRSDPSPAYALPYLLNRDSGGRAFRDILIIGAGSGNDVSRAIQWGAPDAQIDAVEIDPVIRDIGRRENPDLPYQDPRVTVHLGDGRNFLRATSRKYDLVVFALIDSLVLHSSVSNIRLESFLFTRESMADVHRVLKPDGMFVMYNYFRQGWIVSRLSKTLAGVFGQPPLVLTMPYRDRVSANQKAEGFTALFAGRRAAAIDGAFQRHPAYLLRSDTAPSPATPDGFTLPPAVRQVRFSPAKVEIPADLKVASDSWPFLYLRKPMIPSLSWRGMLVLALASLAMLWLFGWRTTPHTATRLNLSMLLLGAGFMLLETKAVVHMALIFGSTWTVNAVVFCAVLVMILGANYWVLRRRPPSLTPYYLVLLAALVANMVTPLDVFLGLPIAVQGVAAGTLVTLPILSAGVIFARLFSRAPRPEQSLAYNTAGAILGGLSEATSMLIGFQWLLGVAALVYIASWLAAGRQSAGGIVTRVKGLT